MDLTYGPEQDILTDVGFCNHLYHLLSLRPGGSFWCAPVCSTWCFMPLSFNKVSCVMCAARLDLRSRGSTKRSKATPMGCEIGVTHQHNLMVGRVVILLLLAMSKGCSWYMEQPRNSLLENHVLFQAFLRLPGVAVRRATTSLG